MARNAMLRMQMSGEKVPDLPRPLDQGTEERRLAAAKAMKRSVDRMPKMDQEMLKAERIE